MRTALNASTSPELSHLKLPDVAFTAEDLNLRSPATVRAARGQFLRAAAAARGARALGVPDPLREMRIETVTRGSLRVVEQITSTYPGAFQRSEVYAAVAEDGEEFFVKRLGTDLPIDAETASFSTWQIPQLFLEAVLLSSFRSPYAPELAELSFSRGRPGWLSPEPQLVTRRMEGASLQRWIGMHAEPPLQDSLRIFRSILRGLVDIHDRGLVHQDLKAPNVVVRPELTAGFVDWESARPAHGSPMEGVFVDLVRGFPRLLRPPDTWPYSSPQQQANKFTTADPQYDLFAAGVLLYHLLVGRDYLDVLTPRNCSAQFRLAQLGGAWPSLRDAVQYVPGLPSGLEKCVESATHPKPAKRFSTAREFLEAFDVAASEVDDRSEFWGASLQPRWAPLGNEGSPWAFALDER